VSAEPQVCKTERIPMRAPMTAANGSSRSETFSRHKQIVEVPVRRPPRNQGVHSGQVPIDRVPVSGGLAVSSEASGPIRQIVAGLSLGVGQPGEHPGGGLPGNFALGVEVPHGVTRFLVGPENLGDQL
jgi:hypothetical protein